MCAISSYILLIDSSTTIEYFYEARCETKDYYGIVCRHATDCYINLIESNVTKTTNQRHPTIHHMADRTKLHRTRPSLWFIEIFWMMDFGTMSWSIVGHTFLCCPSPHTWPLSRYFYWSIITWCNGSYTWVQWPSSQPVDWLITLLHCDGSTNITRVTWEI